MKLLTYETMNKAFQLFFLHRKRYIIGWAEAHFGWGGTNKFKNTGKKEF